MVLSIRQFYLGLALGGSCQIGLSRVCKPRVGDSSLTQSLRNLAIPYKLARTPIQVHASLVSPHTPLAIYVFCADSWRKLPVLAKKCRFSLASRTHQARRDL